MTFKLGSSGLVKESKFFPLLFSFAAGFILLFISITTSNYLSSLYTHSTIRLNRLLHQPLFGNAGFYGTFAIAGTAFSMLTLIMFHIIKKVARRDGIVFFVAALLLVELPAALFWIINPGNPSSRSHRWTPLLSVELLLATICMSLHAQRKLRISTRETLLLLTIHSGLWTYAFYDAVDFLPYTYPIPLIAYFALLTLRRGVGIGKLDGDI